MSKNTEKIKAIAEKCNLEELQEVRGDVKSIISTKIKKQKEEIQLSLKHLESIESKNGTE